MEEIKEEINRYLQNHQTMTLATVNKKNNPIAHTLEYVYDGTYIYFTTNKYSRKINNMNRNCNIGCTVDQSYSNWLEIQGVQLTGVATIMNSGKEMKQVLDMYLRRFPIVAEFPPNPDMVFVKITPTEAFFLDYTKGFTHRDVVTY